MQSTRTDMRLGRAAYMRTLALCAFIASCARGPQAPLQESSNRVSAELAQPNDVSKSPLLLPGGRSIADVAQKVTPSVVNVFSLRDVRTNRISPFFSDPFFRFFFEEPGGRGMEQPRRREQSLGSGVIVSSEGIILTNNHVVEEASEVRVALKDGRELKAKVLGSDPESDVAVLQVEDANDLPALTVADSSKLRIGDLVLAIGNPFGLGQTVTMGIVSAVGRANMGITDYEDFIQTDAAINPGNSGGALVNMDGELVGINTAIASRTGGYQGIGFAIPSNMAVQVKDSIVQHGKVIRGWLGVSIQNVTEDLAEAMDLTARRGVLVSDVASDGPARKGGLERGDVIVAIDGVQTNDTTQLRNYIALAGKGKVVRVDIVRDGKERSFQIELGALPGSSSGPALDFDDDSVFAGLSVRALSEDLRSEFGVPRAVEGVVVTDIRTGSPAAGTGLQVGDVIVSVNRKPTATAEAFRAAARESKTRALALVYRDGVTLFMSLTRE